MSTTHKFDNAFTLTDYSEEIMLVPNQWGLIGQSGLFRTENLGTNTVTFDKTEQTAALVEDKPWGERSAFSGNEKNELHTFAVPTFPLDDTVTVGDVWAKRKIGTPDAQEAVDNVVSKKIVTVRRSHAITAEYAKCLAIRNQKYAPNATISTATWSTEFGTTNKIGVDFDLDDTAEDVREKIQEVVAHIQDNFKGAGVLEDVVFYCSPIFFARLIGNSQVEAAYTNYASDQEPLRNDLRKGMYREFVYQGVTFIEYRGTTPSGLQYFPDVDAQGRAWAVPKGADIFVDYYAPAYRLDQIGADAQEAYLWTYEDRKSTNIEVMSESNFLTMLQRPELVVECDGGVIIP